MINLFINSLFGSTLKRPSLISIIFSYTMLIFWSLVCLFPLYWIIVTSFKTLPTYTNGPFYLPFYDFEGSLSAWETILNDNETYVAFLNSLFISFVSSTIALILGSMAGYAIARITYRPKLGSIILFILTLFITVYIILQFNISWELPTICGIIIFIILLSSLNTRFKTQLNNEDISFWIISTRVLPPVTIVLPIYVLFQQIGILKSHWSLIIAYSTGAIPIAIWLMKEFFVKIPVELEESAIIDGATRYRIWWSIILPLVKPGLAATYIITLISTWNEYLFALFLSTSNTQTLPMHVAGQLTVKGTQWWSMSVVIIIMLMPVLFIAIFLQRFVLSGLLSGSVKG